MELLSLECAKGIVCRDGRETYSDMKGDLEFDLKGGCELDFCVDRVGDIFLNVTLYLHFSLFFRA